MNSFLRLIRFPNLIIVVLSQYLIQYGILIPAFKQVNLVPLLDHFHFSLLVLCTVLIAIAGYIINDILDVEIDQINKPERQIINTHISTQRAKNYFWSSALIGLLIAIYLARHVNNLGLALIFPGAVFILFWYSYRLKRKMFFGNLIVALFCAFVPGVVIFAERQVFFEWIHLEDPQANQLWRLMSIYIAFAFISTLFREIIKDIEDVEGDRSNGCTTLPIQIGIEGAKKVALGLGIIFLSLIIYWMYVDAIHQQNLLLIYLLLGIILPLLIALYLLQKAAHKSDFSQLSKISKYIMSSGLLYLGLYSLVYFVI